MKIVIDIPEEFYEIIKTQETYIEEVGCMAGPLHALSFVSRRRGASRCARPNGKQHPTDPSAGYCFRNSIRSYQTGHSIVRPFPFVP